MATVTVTINHLIMITDFIGVTACAVSATILAQRKGMDLIGAIFISAITAIGGGTLRDLLLQRYPVFWLANHYYLIFIIASSILTLLFYHSISKLERPLRIFDAIGLAAFTLIGVEIALAEGMSNFIAIIMGIVTAAFGGITRDIICNEIPLVLQKEIYVTASLIGGCLFVIMMHFGIYKEIAYPVTLLTIFIMRMYAVYKDLRLPRFTSSI